MHAAAEAADIELEPVSPPPLQVQTSRLNVGMIQRITDIMVVNMRYDTEDDGAVEVQAKLSARSSPPKTPRSPVELLPQLGPEHSTAEIQLAVDGILGQTTFPAAASSIPRSDVAAMRPKGWARLGSRKPFKIAKSKDDITAEWCTRVFRHQGYLTTDERVTELTVKAIGEPNLSPNPWPKPWPKPLPQTLTPTPTPAPTSALAPTLTPALTPTLTLSLTLARRGRGRVQRPRSAHDQRGGGRRRGQPAAQYDRQVLAAHGQGHRAQDRLRHRGPHVQRRLLRRHAARP